MKRLLTWLSAAGLAVFAMTSFVHAQSTYPDRAIKVVVPYPAGTSPDVVARLVSDRLGQALGKPVIVDNRPGAGGMIGAEQAATMPNDGYNLLFTVKGVMAIVPHVYPAAKFHPVKDFKAVAEILQVPHIIVATSKAPFDDMKGMMEYAKKNPGKLNYASNGYGTSPQMSMELFKAMTGTFIVHIPFRGGGDDVQALPAARFACADCPPGARWRHHPWGL
jgi:tripartite-type tricarboxylate transporter receptor subunit TctC